jgi:S1-C subfamily serine protease
MALTGLCLSPHKIAPFTKDEAMKRSSIRALLVAPCLALLGIGFVSPPALADIDTDKVKQATVWVDVSWKGTVYVPFNDSPTPEAFAAETMKYCTGFIVSATGHVATAGHCVEFDDTARQGLLANVIEKNKLAPANGQFDVSKLTWQVNAEKTPTVRIAQPSIVKNAVFDNNGITARLIDYQGFQDGDNALVQVSGKDTSAAVLPITDQSPKIRDQVTAVGFPSDTASITEADRQSPTFKNGSISAETVSTKGVPRFQLDGELISGMSGGPALNEAGQVIGINSSAFNERNQSYITDTATLRTFLERNGIKLTTATNTPSAGTVNVDPQAAPAQAVKENSDNTPMVVLIVVLAVLLLAALGGGALLFLRQRRTQVQPATATASPHTPTPPSNDPPNQGYSI